MEPQVAVPVFNLDLVSLENTPVATEELRGHYEKYERGVEETR